MLAQMAAALLAQHQFVARAGALSAASDDTMHVKHESHGYDRNVKRRQPDGGRCKLLHNKGTKKQSAGDSARVAPSPRDPPPPRH